MVHQSGLFRPFTMGDKHNFSCCWKCLYLLLSFWQDIQNWVSGLVSYMFLNILSVDSWMSWSSSVTDMCRLLHCLWIETGSMSCPCTRSQPQKVVPKFTLEHLQVHKNCACYQRGEESTHSLHRLFWESLPFCHAAEWHGYYDLAWNYKVWLAQQEISVRYASLVTHTLSLKSAAKSVRFWRSKNSKNRHASFQHIWQHCSTWKPSNLRMVQ